MKKLIFLIGLLILMFSCKSKKHKNNIAKVILIGRIAKTEGAVTLNFDFDSDKILIYDSNLPSHLRVPIPPPPPEANLDLTEMNKDSIESEILGFGKAQKEIILKQLDEFNSSDFHDKRNENVLDGVFLYRIILIYENRDLKDFFMINNISDNQRDLIKSLIKSIPKESSNHKSIIKYFCTE